MIKGKKAGKTLDEIGKSWYDFNFKSERTIYSYLCCNRNRIINKELQNLSNDLKFEKYQQWKHYICNKYQNYSKDDLFEFSRYLNLMIRNINPIHEYSSITATVFLSVVFTAVFNFITGTYMDFSNNSVWITFLKTVLLVIPSVIFLTIFIIKMIYPIFDDHFDENFLRDYKEVIDELVTRR